MATKLEFLVAKLKVVLALATVSVAISSPVFSYFSHTQAIIIKKEYSVQSYATFWVTFVATPKNNTQK